MTPPAVRRRNLPEPPWWGHPRPCPAAPAGLTCIQPNPGYESVYRYVHRETCRAASEKERRPAGVSPKQELSAAAYRSLRELIISGRLSPGTALIEADLAGRLGMSRTPVRSAVQRLQQDGFAVPARVGKVLRAVVSPLTAEDMRDVFMMIGSLEGIAARLAAAMDPAARRALVERMKRLNVDLRGASTARPPDVKRAHDLDVALHRSYVEAAASPRLRSALDALQPQAERYQRAYTTVLVYSFEPALREHLKIIAAIAAGDGEAAERHVGENWRNGFRRYLREVTILGERGSW